MNINTIKYFFIACGICSFVGMEARENHRAKMLHGLKNMILEVMDKAHLQESMWKCHASGSNETFIDFAHDIKEAKESVLTTCRAATKGECKLTDCARA